MDRTKYSTSPSWDHFSKHYNNHNPYGGGASDYNSNSNSDSYYLPSVKHDPYDYSDYGGGRSDYGCYGRGVATLGGLDGSTIAVWLMAGGALLTYLLYQAIQTNLAAGGGRDLIEGIQNQFHMLFEGKAS